MRFTDLERDLVRWEAGTLTREELECAHPESTVLVGEHQRLIQTASQCGGDASATWRRVSERIEGESGFLSRLRTILQRPAVVGLSASLITGSAAYALGVPPVRDGIDAAGRGLASLWRDDGDPPDPQDSDGRGLRGRDHSSHDRVQSTTPSDGDSGTSPDAQPGGGDPDEHDAGGRGHFDKDEADGNDARDTTDSDEEAGDPGREQRDEPEKDGDEHEDKDTEDEPDEDDQPDEADEDDEPDEGDEDESDTGDHGDRGERGDDDADLPESDPSERDGDHSDSSHDDDEESARD